ncbi:hypothetical protein VTN77DRAFT_6650 [Rasamsonia byssochlamydoides]|uniref:uncharacterized protein n=1 Tax=Rasamsonia byssochlamydoides TaxID=89139 RepID=UPI0037421044
MKATKEFVDDYRDRRTQARLAITSPNNPLPTGPTPTFASRFADPSHPASSGSLISLVTGGRVDLPLPIIGSGGVTSADWKEQRSGLLSSLADAKSEKGSKKGRGHPTPGKGDICLLQGVRI